MTPELQAKINGACQVLDSVFSQYKNPCFMYSGGKDACLILHMLKEWYQVPPIVWLNIPVGMRKILWGIKNLADHKLDCNMNIPPAGACITQNCEGTEIVFAYPFGKKLMMIPLGRQDFEKFEQWSCGLDLLNTPTGTYDFQHDVAISGQHANDDFSSKSFFHIQKEACDVAFPLKDFTDDDVWTLIDLWNIPVNTFRYEKVDGKWREYPDQLFNNDYHPYCNRCIEIGGDPVVHCPKRGCSVCNVSSQYPIWKKEDLAYV